jgi:hypothetical protein
MIVDYTKMRLGRVVQRWTYQDKDGSTKRAQSKVVKCPACGKNAERSMFVGTYEYTHVLDQDTSGIFAVNRKKISCRVEVPEEAKAEYPGHYCRAIGCWKEAGQDTEGFCTKHQVGPSGGEIKRSIEKLLLTHRLGEAQFDDALGELNRKLGKLNAGPSSTAPRLSDPPGEARAPEGGPVSLCPECAERTMPRGAEGEPK